MNTEYKEEEKAESSQYSWAFITFCIVVMVWLVYDSYFLTGEPDWNTAVSNSSLQVTESTVFSDLDSRELYEYLATSGFYIDAHTSFYLEKLRHHSAAEIRDLMLLVPLDGGNYNKYYSLALNLRVVGATLYDSLERHSFTFSYMIHDPTSFMKKDNQYASYKMYLNEMMGKRDNIDYQKAIISMILTSYQSDLSFYLKRKGFHSRTGSTTSYSPKAIANWPLPILQAIHDNIYLRSSLIERWTKPSLQAINKAIKMNKEAFGK